MILIVSIIFLLCFGACTHEAQRFEQQPNPVPNAAPYEVLAEKAAASVAAAENAGLRLQPSPMQPDAAMSEGASSNQDAMIFYPDMTQPLLDVAPTKDDQLRRPWVVVSRGETTGLVLASVPIRSAAVELAVSLEDRNGQTAKDLSTEVHPIVFAPVSDRERKNYRMQGLWVADPGPVPAEEGHLTAWFIRLQTDSAAEPGEYTLEIKLPWENETLTDSLRVTVLPIRLPDPLEHDYTFGVFCSGGNFNEQQFRQMKRRGLESILFFWPGKF